MGVGADEPRRQHAVARIDRLVHGALEARAHVHDAIALHHHDAVAEQAVAPPVEGDDPAGPDQGPPLARAHERPGAEGGSGERDGGAGGRGGGAGGVTRARSRSASALSSVARRVSRPRLATASAAGRWPAAHPPRSGPPPGRPASRRRLAAAGSSRTGNGR